ncbi:MAG: transglutaminase domain protein, partial [Phycisphaerales bacterium]|nr:transglutaminase domain protein [Phycisphaerales bacterium]
MKFHASVGRITFLALVVVTGSAATAADDAGRTLKQGDAVTLITREGVVTKLDTLPYVESEYTKRFRFDSYDNPKLKELRDRFHLDEIIAPGKTEFDRQVLLLDWVNHRFKKFGKPSSPARGALDVLAAVDEGHSFFCSQYGDVLVSAAASLGWVDRPLALRRPDNRGQG